jgi:hypothetical protein
MNTDLIDQNANEMRPPGAAEQIDHMAARMHEISEKYRLSHPPNSQDTSRVLGLLSVTLERGIERGDLGVIHDAGDMVLELLEVFNFWSLSGEGGK